jgi:ketosteroid isomerase-like protein
MTGSHGVPAAIRARIPNPFVEVRMMTFARYALLAALASPLPTATVAQPASVNLPAAVRAPAAVVDSFHAALRRGDTRTALALLTDDALIFESGGVERGKREYASHHLGADAEFSRAVPSTLTRRAGSVQGNLAWIASEGRVSGSFRGSAVDRKTTETMILRRIGGTWKIAHIHWSSAAARKQAAPPPAAVTPLLAGSVPGNGEVVRAPLNRLELHFSPPARLMEVTLSGPGGLMPMMVTPVGETAHYSLPVSGLGPGSYTVDWRARAGTREDKGSFAFTVR